MVFFCILKQNPSNITIKENQNYIKFDEFYFVLPSLIRNLAALNIFALSSLIRNLARLNILSFGRKNKCDLFCSSLIYPYICKMI